MVLEEAAVVISPGSMYGPSGEGFFRISLTTPDERISEAVERMREHLSYGSSRAGAADVIGGCPSTGLPMGDERLDELDKRAD